jgi:hypothetical protein
MLTGLAALIATTPLADATTTDIAILSLASMIAGYVLLAGLWYFVFREKREDKSDGGSDQL